MSRNSRTFGASGFLFVALGSTLSLAAAIEPVSVHTVDTCVYPAHFVDEGEHEVELASLVGLPEAVRSKLHDYLDARLGKEFASRLRFRGGGFVDPEDVPTVIQSYRDLGREYEAYVVLFTLELEEGRQYCAGVHLNIDGDIVMDIGLPKIAATPSKARIVPASTAMAIAATNRLKQPSPLVKLQYDPERDVLVWKISEMSRNSEHEGQFTTCNIDAHTGKFIGWTAGVFLFN